MLTFKVKKQPTKRERRKQPTSNHEITELNHVENESFRISGSINKNENSMENQKKVVANESETNLGHSHNHNHSHKHSHNHHTSSIKSSILMVILGDGLHNFSDGLAIGASFASSITTGIGTTVAVFFHELPHEIGDFAVLRKKGVSLKRALLFNVLSSILCFLGVFIGLVIGSIHFLSSWSFLFIAGTFLYISLVDIVRGRFIK